MERLSNTVIFVALLAIVVIIFSIVITLPSLEKPSSPSTTVFVSPAPEIDYYDTVSSPVIKKGKELFDDNCTSCHAVHTRKVGPALKDVDQKRERTWLHKWIRNSSALRASGDKEAIAIYNEYQKLEMTSFSSFTDEEINAILEFISHDSKIIPKTAYPEIQSLTIE